MKLVHVSVPVLVVLLLCIITPKCLGQLSAKDASEGPCLSGPELQPYLSDSTDVLPLLPPGRFYVPMGSKALYRHYAQGLLGRPANNQAELDTMQLILEAGVAVTKILNTGFPHLTNPPRFSQLCFSATLPNLLNLGITNGRINAYSLQIACFGTTAVRIDGTVAIKAPSTSSVDSVIWANSDTSVILIYRCADDGIKDFKVLSRNKTLADNDISIVKQNIVRLGFSENFMAYMMYD